MGMPNYLRKNNRAASAIVAWAKDLAEYIFAITNNEKQFGKIMRYTLSSELRTCCIKMIENIDIAYSIMPRHKKDYRRRIKYQQKAYEEIIKLNSLIILSYSVASVRNKEQLAKLFTIVLDDYNRWIKTDKRAFKNLPNKKQYRKILEKQKQKAMRTAQLKAAYKVMDKNENGFIILKRKT